MKATIALNMVEPTPTLAYHIAQQFNKQQRYQEAVKYYNQAIEQETDPLVRYRYRVELGYIIYSDFNDPIKAKQIAMKAIQDNPNSGQPHMLLGNIYAGTKDFGEDELANDAVFWAAVDQYTIAKNKDPELAEMANEKIRLYSQYFPDTETAFFYGFKEGDTYKLGGWIDETTTVRFRQ
jgi:tetratricopeptide (TPR) repeat protein